MDSPGRPPDGRTQESKVSKRIERRPKARIDLAEIYSYIVDDNLDAAERLVEAAERDFARLADMPGMGPRWGFKKARLKDVRFCPIKGFRNYLIFYRPIEGGIEVL